MYTDDMRYIDSKLDSISHDVNMIYNKSSQQLKVSECKLSELRKLFDYWIIITSVSYFILEIIFFATEHSLLGGCLAFIAVVNTAAYGIASDMIRRL